MSEKKVPNFLLQNTQQQISKNKSFESPHYYCIEFHPQTQKSEHYARLDLK